jgi:hypothetical protein
MNFGQRRAANLCCLPMIHGRARIEVAILRCKSETVIKDVPMSTSSHSPVISSPAVAVPQQPLDPAVRSAIYTEVARLGLGEQFPAAIALTREIFGDFTIRISADPEIHECNYVTFHVRCGDASGNMFEKETE